MSETCQVTVRRPGRGRHAEFSCGEPLAESASFCAKHEADRARLTDSEQRLFSAASDAPEPEGLSLPLAGSMDANPGPPVGAGDVAPGHSTLPRNGRGGPDSDRAFHLTRKGWVAAILAQHPSLGRTW